MESWQWSVRPAGAETPADVARDRLTRVGRLLIRLLGDALLRRRGMGMRQER